MPAEKQGRFLPNPFVVQIANSSYDPLHKGSLVVEGKTDRKTEPDIVHPNPKIILPPVVGKQVFDQSWMGNF